MNSDYPGIQPGRQPQKTTLVDHLEDNLWRQPWKTTSQNYLGLEGNLGRQLLKTMTVGSLRRQPQKSPLEDNLDRWPQETTWKITWKTTSEEDMGSDLRKQHQKMNSVYLKDSLEHNLRRWPWKTTWKTTSGDNPGRQPQQINSKNDMKETADNLGRQL